MQPGARLAVLRRFAAYGCAGWVLEVLFTGAKAALARDPRLAARTYLWMHPIYGAAGLALEQLHRGPRRSRSRLARAAASLAVIYAAEYGSGAVLRRLLGECPWRYREGLHLHGLVRLDYAPFWLALAVGYGAAHDALTGPAGAPSPEASGAPGPDAGAAIACPRCSAGPPTDRFAA